MVGFSSASRLFNNVKTSLLPNRSDSLYSEAKWNRCCAGALHRSHHICESVHAFMSFCVKKKKTLLLQNTKTKKDAYPSLFCGWWSSSGPAMKFLNVHEFPGHSFSYPWGVVFPTPIKSTLVLAWGVLGKRFKATTLCPQHEAWLCQKA